MKRLISYLFMLLLTTQPTTTQKIELAHNAKGMNGQADCVGQIVVQCSAYQ